MTLQTTPQSQRNESKLKSLKQYTTYIMERWAKVWIPVVSPWMSPWVRAYSCGSEKSAFSRLGAPSTGSWMDEGGRLTKNRWPYSKVNSSTTWCMAKVSSKITWRNLSIAGTREEASAMDTAYISIQMVTCIKVSGLKINHMVRANIHGYMKIVPQRACGGMVASTESIIFRHQKDVKKTFGTKDVY